MRLAGLVAAMVLAGVVAGTVADVAQLPELPPVGQLQKVRNNLYVIPGQGSNTAVFVTRTGAVLVDTKLPGNGAAIMERVAAVSDLPVTTIINTHGHLDHVGGNEFFAPSVELIAQERTRARMLGMDSIKDSPQALPDRTFSDRLTIGRGQDRVELYYFGAAHTDGDAIVVFPGVRAMHAGDLYPSKTAGAVDSTSGGSAIAYADTLEKAVKGITNVDTVIEGHGDVTTWAAFVTYTEFMRTLAEAALSAKRAGKTREQAAADLRLPSKFDSYVTEGAAAFIAAVYAESPAK